MPDDPQNNEDEDDLEDDDSSEFELTLEADISDIDLSADLDIDKTRKDLHGKKEPIVDPTSTPIDLPFINLTDMTIPASVVELVPESVARENVVLPLSQENGILKIIMSDPTDVDTVQKLQFILNKDIQPVLAPREQIIEAIDRHYGQTETEDVDAMLLEFTDTAIDFTEPEATQSGAAADDSDPRVVKLVNLIITEAIWLGASNIHIEPFSDRVRVRYRIDGELVERDSPPRWLLAPILSHIKIKSNIATSERPEPQDGRIKRLLARLLPRIKIESNIDISERPQPRDGRIKMIVEGKHFDLRVSILPTHHGESVVIRIPNRIGIEALGLAQDDYQRFRQIMRRPNGLFLVTGPMGSGKTTTVYAAVDELNRPDRKIITAEDPVEYALPGIAQWQIHHDLTFANTLRSILRQDPDIIVVGEIRDHETAQIAVQAALSGRLVLSTLDANDAPSSITRLRGMGLEPSLITATVKAILAQRLVRKICEDCRTEFQPSPEMLMELNLRPQDVKGKKFYYGRGCDRCNNTGYRGRCGIFELVTMNDDVRDRHLAWQKVPEAVDKQARWSYHGLAGRCGPGHLRADGSVPVPHRAAPSCQTDHE